ncbi:MAG TPA: PDZ domain-containing protein [Kofleriaceae bacterium]|jgi:S1-C subfamily serine protease
MSVDTPPEPEQTPVLRREALLPNERSRGLGTIAVVCTMAGVASGLALATTLMAMQVADSMSVRQCPYHVVVPEQTAGVMHPDHGFLGVRTKSPDGAATIDRVLPNTPAAATGIHPGDHVLSIDGYSVRSWSDMQSRIYGMHPGEQVSLVVERGDAVMTMHPTLVAWPIITY